MDATIDVKCFTFYLRNYLNFSLIIAFAGGMSAIFLYLYPHPNCTYPQKKKDKKLQHILHLL